jgi:hypothetical protein
VTGRHRSPFAGPAAPWPRRRAPVDPVEGFDEHALHVFVPAIMSVGLLVSIATLVRDGLRRTTGRTRERRIALETATTVDDILGRPTAAPETLGLLHHWSYVAAGLSSLAVGGTVVAAATAAYADPADDRGPAWLLALGVTVAALSAVVAAACLAVWIGSRLSGRQQGQHPGQ